MPIYEYSCSLCQSECIELVRKIADRHDNACPYHKCASRLKVSPFTDNTFKPFVHPDLGLEPVYIESKKQLKKECEERGLRSAIIEDS